MSVNLSLNINYCRAEGPQEILVEWNEMLPLRIFIFLKPLSEEGKSNTSYYYLQTIG